MSRQHSQCPKGFGKKSHSRIYAAIVALPLLAGKGIRGRRLNISTTKAKTTIRIRYDRVRLGVGGLSLLLFSLLPIPAHATNGTLTINADTTLTEDHAGDIIIAADGVTLDCDGHTVTGPGVAVSPSIGIDLTGRTGVTVKNCHVTNFPSGFFLMDSSDNTLKKNTATQNDTGFFLMDSSDNTLKKNTATQNDTGFFLGLDSSGNTLTRNAATGNNNGFLLRSEAIDNTLTENTAIGNNNNGFLLNDVFNNTLTGNTANDNPNIGFLVDVESFGNFLVENEACNNFLVDARQEMFSSNEFEGNEFCTTDGI